MGAKCNHAYRQCSARVRSPLGASVQCEQSSALRTSGAGSFQAVTPLPPQAPEEESRPSTPRYGFAVLIPACYSSTPLPGRIPPEVFRAAGVRPSRPLAQTLSDSAPAASAKDCAGGSVPGFAINVLLLLDRG